MPTELELMHGWDEIVLHDFAPCYFCGKCGYPMEKVNNGYVCKRCSMKLAGNSTGYI